MQFMIDFENTGSAGLRGASFLLPEDTVTIFYSESSDKAESGFMSDIFASGCVCRGYKLFRSGKNSLDFYIASEFLETDTQVRPQSLVKIRDLRELPTFGGIVRMRSIQSFLIPRSRNVFMKLRKGTNGHIMSDSV